MKAELADKIRQNILKANNILADALIKALDETDKQLPADMPDEQRMDIFNLAVQTASESIINTSKQYAEKLKGYTPDLSKFKKEELYD